MRVIDILDQLSAIYSQPTRAVMEQNNIAFRSPYYAANAHEILFCCIKDCTEIALLRCSPYMDCQLINNMIPLLLTTGLYLWPFEEWDQPLPVAQTWTALRINVALMQWHPQQDITDMLPQCLFSKMPLEC
jgi:hypothetical protein